MIKIGTISLDDLDLYQEIMSRGKELYTDQAGTYAEYMLDGITFILRYKTTEEILRQLVTQLSADGIFAYDFPDYQEIDSGKYQLNSITIERK